MPQIALLINPHSGGSAQEKTISELLSQDAYSAFTLIHLDVAHCKKCVVDLIGEGYTTIVACGGDGTISTVAQVILENNLQVKFGVLPLGTFNHFAKDLGMPLDIPQTLDVILKGKTTYVDVGKVNDMYFINNSSLGLYARLVAQREQIQKKGWRKSFALIVAIFMVLKSHKHLSLEFNSESGIKTKRTALVFIGNNKYELAGFSLGKRNHLDHGILSVSIIGDVGIVKLILFCFHALRGKLIEQKEFNVVGLQECTITTRKGSIDVSYDGERITMKTPLHYKIVPKALLVIIP